ncbi:uncharacterized protein LOC130500060 [Raphanus sativus]|uniref:Uncharacterized protein LOC130500060 n=1 Tax=Raphanus sativus TaxID=3726 RepID=A0A9W3CHG4_RAPSA|nr:uncharacterized protein LOC130500060 [Raphanus sativus]
MGSIINISNVSDIKPYKPEWRVEVKVLHKTTSHVYKMVFRNETTITDSSLHCDNMFLDLYDFENMLNGSHDTRFLIDVMGEVLDLGVLKNVQNARTEVNKVEFTLRDIKDNRIHCCIMGRSAHILADDAHKLNNGDICLIRFAKLQNLDGKIQVSNAFDCSLVLINPSIEEARALNRRFNGDENSGVKKIIHQAASDKIEIQNKRHKWSQSPFNTIHEMIRTAKGEHCRVICTIYAIDTMSGWYYFSCVVCNNKVSKSRIAFDELDVQKWWCEFCEGSVLKVSPRFNLNLLVQDLTGESKFSLLDYEATYIVKSSAAKVLNGCLDEVLRPLF